jgi:ferredoxin
MSWRSVEVKVAVDIRKCCGSGNCVMHVPEVFQPDEATGLVRLVTAQPAVALWDEVRAAADECPMRAITATDA